MLRLAMKALTSAGTYGNDEWELPLPPKPESPLQGRGIEKFECCGGSLLPCFGCGKEFKLYLRLQTHKRRSCPASAEPKLVCRFCGTGVIKDNLKRHVRENKKCLLAKAAH